MAKSVNKNKNATRKVRSGFFSMFGGGMAANLVFGILRGFGMAIGFSGVAVLIVILSAIISQIPIIAELLHYLGISF